MYTRLGKMNSISFGNSTIRYRIKRSPRRKTTQILVDRSGVKVISPLKMSENRIKELVRKNSKWIYKKQLWAKEESNAKLLFKDGSRVPYMGRMYLLKVKEAKTERILFSRGKFTVRVTKNTPKRVRMMFRNWLKERAYRVIEQRANHYAKKIGVKYALMVNSGSSANLLATFAAGNLLRNNHFKRGDEVLIPVLCWPTSLWPLVQFGLKPRFIDIDINTSEIEIGEHRLFTRFQDSEGNWSGAVSSPFTVVSPPITYTMQAAEYYFDSDPGEGNGIAIDSDYSGEEAPGD